VGSSNNTFEGGLMKRAVILTISVLFVFVTLAGAAEVKIGYVDLQKALNECLAGKEAKESLKKAVEQKQKAIQEKERAIEALKAEIEAKQTVLSEEALQKKQDKLDRLMRDYKRFVQDANEELKKKEAQYTNQILMDLRDIVIDLGKKRGYTIIFERVPGVLLYVDETLDLTDEVIKLYDEKYKKDKNK
jgi:outer membrane protein